MREWRFFRIEVPSENDCCDKQQAQGANKQVYYALGFDE